MDIPPLLQPYIAVAELLTHTFGEDCEVVLHDLETPERSVVYVSNNRSSALLIKDDAGRLSGAMCINPDATRLTRQMEFLQSLMPPAPEPKPVRTEPMPEVSGHISEMVDGLIHGIIGTKRSVSAVSTAARWRS